MESGALSTARRGNREIARTPSPITIDAYDNEFGSDMTSNAEASLTIRTGVEMVTVIERFAFGDEPGWKPDSDAPARPGLARTASAEQAEGIDSASRMLHNKWGRDNAFVAGLLLRSRVHNRLAVYSQWRRPAHGVPAEVPPKWSMTAALREVTATRLLDSRTFTVEFTAGNKSMTVVSAAATPLVHFGIFTFPAEDQDKLLDLARMFAPRSLTTPGLAAINFHRSVDTTEVINMGTWTSFDSFDKLLDQPGFVDDNVYWHGVSDFQPDFFDVVDVGARG